MWFAHLGLDDKEVIQRQKLLLNKRLGLEGPAAEGMELFNEEDLKMPEQPSKKPSKVLVSSGILIVMKDIQLYDWVISLAS